jgi:lipopolysaccharide transport system ATP-binding protein
MGHIRVRNIGKAYKRYARKWGRFAEWMGAGIHHELRWALRDVTFHVTPGQAVGIIGFNGAGKSTLLKIISGTTRATTGDVSVGGRVAALLELGLGFHPDFTGRQNAYMAGQLRGIRTDELGALMRQIEDFAAIGDYIDQPLRMYSSGMQVRLAFSVATAVRPEILIVDEALAVGDVLFQQKCFDRIREFCRAGTTLLFVSHSMGSVYSLCDRALLINEGRIAVDGEPKEAIDLYNALAVRAREHSPEALAIVGDVANAPTDVDAAAPPTTAVTATHSTIRSSPGAEHPDTGSLNVQPGSYSRPGASIAVVQLLHEHRVVDAFVSESTVSLQVITHFDSPYDDPHIGFQIRDSRGEAVFMTNTHCMGMQIGPVRSGEDLSVSFCFRAALAPGDYSVTAGVANGGLLEGFFREALVRSQDIRSFTVLRNMDSILWSGAYNLAPTCSVERFAASAT